jgi:RNA polymerase sigma-70 factor (ECF subfamily)
MAAIPSLPLTNKVADINAALLQDVSNGSEKAFRELVHRYADLLHTYIYQLTRCRETAEEVVQDIFLQIWMCRETLGGIRNFRTYLFVISRNKALNVLKKALRERRHQAEWERTVPGAEAEAAHSELEGRLSLVEEAILHLPPQQRQAWVLSRRQGKKYEEIAKEMNLSRETVKKYIQYATQSITRYVTQRLDLTLLVALAVVN